MIIQSNIGSSSKEGKSWGLIATIGFHALILALILLLVIPEPESHPLDPVIMVNFGDPDMGGPSTEMAGGSGAEATSESEPVESPLENNEEIIDNPNADVVVNAPKKTEKTTTTKANPTKVETPKERKPEEGSTFNKKGRTKKGTGDGNSNGPVSSEGRGDGLIPGEQGSPNGTIDGTKDGNDHLKAQYRPKQIKKAVFEDEETDDPNPKKMYVIVTVDCSGVIKKVSIDTKNPSDTKNFKYIKNKLIGEKYFDARDNCKGFAQWPWEIVITPN